MTSPCRLTLTGIPPRIYGYHLPSTVDESTATPDNDKKRSRPEHKRQCLDEAAQAIAGTGPLGNSDLVRRIARESYVHSRQSPHVTKALNQWSSCMAAEGHHYPTPQDAESACDLNSAVVSPHEIDVAVADVSCKQNARLVDTWYNVETDHQKAEIAKHARELDSAMTAHDQCMRRVSDVITQHS